MKRRIVLLFAATLALSSFAQQNPWLDTNLPFEKRVDDLV